VRGVFASIGAMETDEKEGGVPPQAVRGEVTDARVYELGYLLVPTIAEEDLSVNYGNLKELVASLLGQVISDDMPKMMTLAYPMLKVTENVRSKFDTAYFGWIKFKMDAEKILELKKHLDLDPLFLRFIIVKTVKENTLASKRFVGGGQYRRGPVVKKYTEKVEPAIPINKEEVDKEIEALVAI
jgi:ribosomal protein S6